MIPSAAGEPEGEGGDEDEQRLQKGEHAAPLPRGRVLCGLLQRVDEAPDGGAQAAKEEDDREHHKDARRVARRVVERVLLHHRLPRDEVDPDEPKRRKQARRPVCTAFERVGRDLVGFNMDMICWVGAIGPPMVHAIVVRTEQHAQEEPPRGRKEGAAAIRAERRDLSGAVGVVLRRSEIRIRARSQKNANRT